MKRHISIFAFLLGAFAAGFASEAGASQTVYGGYCYFGKVYQSDEMDKYMSVNGGFMPVTLVKGGTAHCETNGVPPGMRVSNWGYVESNASTVLTDVQEYGNLTWTGNKSGAYDFVNDDDKNAYAAIAVRFDYIKYNVIYNANGGSPTPESALNQSYKANLALAAAPVKTGYTFKSWKASSNGKTFAAGASVSGSKLGLGDCHVDGSNVTMTAAYTANVYKVTFNGNDGGSPDPGSKTVTYGKTYGDLATCSRTGYTFAGWYTEKSGGTQITSTSKVQITANQTLYAHWTAKTYTVTVVPNGGTGGSCPNYTVSTAQQTKTVTKPTRPGYSISGWTVTGATGGTPTVAGTTLSIPANVSGNLTLTPSWTPNSYSITYTGNKAAHSNPSTYTIESETIVFTPPDDVVGFKFTGWSPASIAKGSTGNLTVTANYLTKVDYPVATTPLTYNGSVQSCASSTTQYQAKDNQQTIPGQYAVTFELNTGYCWSDGKTGSYSVPWEIQKADLTGVSVGQSGSLTYTGEEQTPVINAQARAQGGQTVIWEYSASGSAFSTVVPSFKDAGTYTVHYRANAQYHNQISGTFTVTIERAKAASVDVSPSELPYTKKEQGPTVTVRNCTTGGDLRATDVGTYRITAQPKTNYAWPNGGTEERTFEWSIVDSSYTIEFDGAGGLGSMEPVTLVRDEPYVVANAFTKKGCEFVTWRTVIGGVATNFDVGVTVSNLASVAGTVITFTADWLGRYTVAFDKNGGEGTMTNVTYEADREYRLPSNAFTRSGYHFTGWATNGTEVVFTNCAAVSNLAAPGETCTLKAQWKEIALGEAMHCNDTNLVWESKSYYPVSVNEWTPEVGANIGYDGDSCVQQIGASGNLGKQQWLQTQVSTNGHFSFKWKPSGENGEISIAIMNNANPPGRDDYKPVSYISSEWQTCEVDISKGYYMKIVNSGASTCSIDRMTWTPEGSDKKPEYVDFDSPVEGFSMADGKLGFSFEGDGISTYHLLGTNDLVAPMPWPMVFEIGKPSGSFSFEIPIKEDEPKMFYRIRALK